MEFGRRCLKWQEAWKSGDYNSFFQFIFLDREKDGGKGMDRAVKKKYCQFFQSGLKNSGFRKHGSKRTEKLPGAEIQKPFKQSF